VGHTKDCWLRMTTALVAREGTTPTPGGLCTGATSLPFGLVHGFVRLAQERFGGVMVVVREGDAGGHHHLGLGQNKRSGQSGFEARGDGVCPQIRRPQCHLPTGASTGGSRF
jgi:hypothetical protein